jgi:hypothetical protein
VAAHIRAWFSALYPLFLPPVASLGYSSTQMVKEVLFLRNVDELLRNHLVLYQKIVLCVVAGVRISCPRESYYEYLLFYDRRAKAFLPSFSHDFPINDDKTIVISFGSSPT